MVPLESDALQCLDTLRMLNDVMIFGCGGHAKVVADAVALSRHWKVVSFCESAPVLNVFLGQPVYALQEVLDLNSKTKICIAVGENSVRQTIAGQLGASVEYPVIQHPNSIASGSLEVGAGSVILANAAINASVKIGRHVIVNTGAILEHDCIVHDYATLAPGSIVCGGCTLGEGVFLGAGAIVQQGISIGAWSVVAAGSVVTRDVPSNTMVAGAPAEFKRMNPKERHVY